jgi:N-methylhydantoinase A
MHAAFIADELEISKVVIPVSPGHFSAFGCLSSDLRQTHVRSCRFKVVDDEWSQIESLSAALEAQAINSIGSDGLSTDQLRIEREFGLRYVGQSWELDVSVPHNVKSAEALSGAFELAYRQRYQHVHKLSVECVSIRVTVIGPVQAPIIGSDFERANACEVTHRSVYFGSGFHDTPVYIRASLPNSVRGPALIEESGALTVVPPGWRVSIGGESELRLEKND